MGQTVSSKFASVSYALQGKKHSDNPKIEKNQYKSKDLGNFFDGVEAKGSEE
jgi:hypothetical protein